ncbi:TMEM175 family protein [Deinococcus frigens]|uniref:TMEM175 family protein n=1 Tax=Deinococcus frigens TaxID=249403 RepID=UPI0012EBEA3B|nr:TMEM175 family protein [Deinococcus frigens]
MPYDMAENGTALPNPERPEPVRANLERPAAAGHEIPASRVPGMGNGVFAIVITLLVLELRPPGISGVLDGAGRAQELNGAILNLLPRLIVFFVTFLVAGISWVSHTWSQSHLSRLDSRLAFLNIIYLMFVSLLPVPSAPLGAFGDTPTGLASYALNQVLIVLAFLWMLWHAVRHGLMAPGWQAERLGSGR